MTCMKQYLSYDFKFGMMPLAGLVQLIFISAMNFTWNNILISNVDMRKMFNSIYIIYNIYVDI